MNTIIFLAKKNVIRILMPLLLLVIAGCDDGSSSKAVVTPAVVASPAMVDFIVTIDNLTVGQPLSPATVVVHRSDYSLFEIGAPASVGLEMLAEGGDNTRFLADNIGNSSVVISAGGNGPIGPGGSYQMKISIVESELDGLLLSGLAMLVNTNDGFAAERGLPISSLAVGESMQVNATAYDAGTEFNSEAAGTMPGPADGGEGFNAARDDLQDAVSGHPGVVSSADGLMNSVLAENHRFDNPVARYTVVRMN